LDSLVELVIRGEERRAICRIHASRSCKLY
jgi:hypothetical protein